MDELLVVETHPPSPSGQMIATSESSENLTAVDKLILGHMSRPPSFPIAPYILPQTTCQEKHVISTGNHRSSSQGSHTHVAPPPGNPHLGTLGTHLFVWGKALGLPASASMSS